MLLSSFRLASRALVRCPGFALLAMITFGLGIGAHTAMFSKINSTRQSGDAQWTLVSVNGANDETHSRA